MDTPTDEARSDFDYLSNEYAQALEALVTIETKAETLVVLGSEDELRGFIDRFLEMARGTRQLAEDRNEPNFVEWFGELITRAEALRRRLAER
jgi:hypothetical protein